MSMKIQMPRRFRGLIRPPSGRRPLGSPSAEFAGRILGRFGSDGPRFAALSLFLLPRPAPPAFGPAPRAPRRRSSRGLHLDLSLLFRPLLSFRRSASPAATGYRWRPAWGREGPLIRHASGPARDGAGDRDRGIVPRLPARSQAPRWWPVGRRPRSSSRPMPGRGRRFRITLRRLPAGGKRRFGMTSRAGEPSRLPVLLWLAAGWPGEPARLPGAGDRWLRTTSRAGKPARLPARLVAAREHRFEVLLRSGEPALPAPPLARTRDRVSRTAFRGRQRARAAWASARLAGRLLRLPAGSPAPAIADRHRPAGRPGDATPAGLRVRFGRRALGSRRGPPLVTRAGAGHRTAGTRRPEAQEIGRFLSSAAAGRDAAARRWAPAALGDRWPRPATLDRWPRPATLAVRQGAAWRYWPPGSGWAARGGQLPAAGRLADRAGRLTTSGRKRWSGLSPSTSGSAGLGGRVLAHRAPGAATSSRHGPAIPATGELSLAKPRSRAARDSRDQVARLEERSRAVAVEAPPPPPLDLPSLVDRVQDELERRLRIERQRQGL